MKRIARVVCLVGGIVIFISLLSTWGGESYWKSFVSNFDRLNLFGTKFGWIRFAIGLYILFPVLTLISGLSVSYSGKGFPIAFVISILNLIIIFYVGFSGGEAGEFVGKLGGTSTIIWFGTAAVAIGSGIALLEKVQTPEVPSEVKKEEPPKEEKKEEPVIEPKSEETPEEKPPQG